MFCIVSTCSISKPSRLCDLTPLVSNDKACLGLIALTLLSMLDFFPFYYHSLSSASDHEVGKHKRLELSMSLSLGTHKATCKKVKHTGSKC